MSSVTENALELRMAVKLLAFWGLLGQAEKAKMLDIINRAEERANAT